MRLSALRCSQATIQQLFFVGTSRNIDARCRETAACSDLRVNAPIGALPSPTRTEGGALSKGARDEVHADDERTARNRRLRRGELAACGPQGAHRFHAPL